MSGHTPGPWGVFAGTHICAQGDFIAQVPEASKLCRYRRGENYCELFDETRANARLIAAAPDLLALLVELTDIEGPQPGHVEWYRKVRAAIAKATGGQP